MTFDADEKSLQDSRPLELYDFAYVTGLHVYYTSATRAVSFGGHSYTPATIKRNVLTVVDSQNVPSMDVTLPVTDPVVQSFIGRGVPPQKMRLTISRLQQRSGEVAQLWTGSIAGCTVSGREATFRISAGTGDPFNNPLPGVAFSKQCNHVLYNQQCTVSRTANQVATTIAVLGPDFRTITVASVGGFTGASDFLFGDAVHGPSGERRTIAAQAGSVLTLDVRLPNTALAGDTITIARGCKHDIATCRDKFNNVRHFGGHPHLKSTNYFYSNIKRIPGA